MLSKMLDVLEIHDITGLSPVTIRRKFWRGEWPHTRIGRSVKMSSDDLERILRESRKPAKIERAAPGALSEDDVMAAIGPAVENSHRRADRGADALKGKMK